MYVNGKYFFFLDYTMYINKYMQLKLVKYRRHYYSTPGFSLRSSVNKHITIGKSVNQYINCKLFALFKPILTAPMAIHPECITLISGEYRHAGDATRQSSRLLDSPGTIHTVHVVQCYLRFAAGCQIPICDSKKCPPPPKKKNIQ